MRSSASNTPTCSVGHGRRTTRRAFGVAALALASLFAGVSSAQTFPSKPLKLIVPFAPGGSVDAIARALAVDLAPLLGQPVVVENKAGGGSVVGTDFVARAPADGYTLLITSPAIAVNVTLRKTLPYDARKSLAPVAMLAHAPGVLLVDPKLPIKTLQDYVAAARRSPGTINFASGGAGSTEHLTGEMFKALARLDIVHIPYPSATAAVTDLMAGRVQSFFTNQANVIGQIKSGNVRVVAVADDKRSEITPDVPTFAEAGFPEQQVSVWWGVMAPAGTPPEVVERLNRDIVAVVRTPAMQQRIAGMGARTRDPMTAKQFGDFIESEIKRWGGAVKSSGVQLD